MTRQRDVGIVTAHGALADSLFHRLSSLERFSVRCFSDSDSCLEALGDEGLELLLVDVSYSGEQPSTLDSGQEQPEDQALHELLRAARERSVRLMLLGLDPASAVGERLLVAETDASLPLETGFEDLVSAMDQVLEGAKIYPPSIAYRLYERLAQKASEHDLRQRLAALALTPRELEILTLVADHCSNETIAGRLGISIHTVKNHVHNILDKLQVDSRSSAAELALEQGWLEPRRAADAAAAAVSPSQLAST
ncbi:MAG: response regulator transcription factor [Acidobacteriota bacterium]